MFFSVHVRSEAIYLEPSIGTHGPIRDEHNAIRDDSHILVGAHNVPEMKNSQNCSTEMEVRAKSASALPALWAENVVISEATRAAAARSCL